MNNGVLTLIFSAADANTQYILTFTCKLWRYLLVAPRVKYIITEASKAGNLPMLQWAFGIGFPCDRPAAITAAESGYIHILKWM